MKRDRDAGREYAEIWGEAVQANRKLRWSPAHGEPVATAFPLSPHRLDRTALMGEEKLGIWAVRAPDSGTGSADAP